LKQDEDYRKIINPSSSSKTKENYQAENATNQEKDFNEFTFIGITHYGFNLGVKSPRIIRRNKDKLKPVSSIHGQSPHSR